MSELTASLQDAPETPEPQVTSTIENESAIVLANGNDPQQEDYRKLFVGALSWDISEADLIHYFSRWGKVIECIIKRDRFTGQSRGFGFVTLENEDILESILNVKQHYLKDRQIDPKRAKSSREPLKKVFVGGLDPELSEEKIKEYFSQFGEVLTLDLPYDSEKGKRRHYIFVTFATEEAAQKAIEQERQNIYGRHCDVRAALTRNHAYRQRALKTYPSSTDPANMDYSYDVNMGYGLGPYGNCFMNPLQALTFAAVGNGYAPYGVPTNQMQRLSLVGNKQLGQGLLNSSNTRIGMGPGRLMPGTTTAGQAQGQQPNPHYNMMLNNAQFDPNAFPSAIDFAGAHQQALPHSMMPETAIGYPQHH